jgi:2-keto-4-pentenoate hydratase/2-oxohepta-3-ene-1,7-dioic acid hydratase in catechol pathway
MKLITFLQGADPRPGLALSETVGIDVPAANPSLPANWHVLYGNLEPLRNIWGAHLPQLGEMEQKRLAGEELPLPFVNLRQVTLLAPVILPSKIICVGLNYRDHAEEQNKPLPQKPMLFSKASTCLQAPELAIELTPELTQVDAEGELAVVIGKPGRAIRPENAVDHIAGYTCFNDVSDREAQHADKQFFRGKSADTFGPCGPWLVTPDDLPDLAHGLKVTCHWNDTLMQSSNTDQLIFPVDELIAHASRNMTLLPGDIISTGTPGGVGVFREPKVFLQAGDKVTVEIEGIGKLVNPVRWRD